MKNLAEKGTDIIFVEKEGIPEILTFWADKHGIAMVNTRGHLTEYGKDLMNVAKKSGAHVVIMTDYDATGVNIVSESPTEMPWIGANDTMLVYFHLEVLLKLRPRQMPTKITFASWLKMENIKMVGKMKGSQTLILIS